ncbi:hemerythrin domain-containing protein [Rugosimonospora acidiphila]|uniref:Hemerythrin domain-containing protein n=1 Tax=Rugosimonospora acidiphila TaxID=556531 RepID=A0ABP9RVC6_9ACTN
MTTTGQRDVVDVLIDQHEQIRRLLSEVRAAQGGRRRDLFEDLVRLLAAHESAEETVVHPSARAVLRAGHDVVDLRLDEEHGAKQTLASLYGLGVDHPTFDRRLAELTRQVLEHAANEENEELRYLRENLEPARLVAMAAEFEAAQAKAPTRPHPRAGTSRAANLAAGPPLALFDRLRDAVREWREPHDGHGA